MKIIKPFLVFIVIIACTFALVSFRQGNFSSAKDIIPQKECGKIVYNPVGERNVVLRVDDIQEYAWFDAQEKIIDDAKKRNIPLVLGVIPSRLEEDKRIWSLLIGNRCNMEIALHGFEHTPSEFSNYNYSEADLKMKEGLQILNQIEPNIVTFIPPSNNYSKGTGLAAENDGLFMISSNSEDSKYGYTESTYNWDYYYLENYSDVLLGCSRDLDKTGLCVIMIHPQDFVTNGKLDEKKYSQYLHLLNGVKSLNANIVTFRDLERNQTIHIN